MNAPNLEILEGLERDLSEDRHINASLFSALSSDNKENKNNNFVNICDKCETFNKSNTVYISVIV